MDLERFAAKLRELCNSNTETLLCLTSERYIQGSYVDRTILKSALSITKTGKVYEVRIRNGWTFFRLGSQSTQCVQENGKMFLVMTTDASHIVFVYIDDLGIKACKYPHLWALYNLLSIIYKEEENMNIHEFHQVMETANDIINNQNVIKTNGLECPRKSEKILRQALVFFKGQNNEWILAPKPGWKCMLLHTHATMNGEMRYYAAWSDKSLLLFYVATDEGYEDIVDVEEHLPKYVTLAVIDKLFQAEKSLTGSNDSEAIK